MKDEMKDDPKLAKREERLGRDLDNDQEKGESARHRRRVLGEDLGRMPRSLRRLGR